MEWSFSFGVVCACLASFFLPFPVHWFYWASVRNTVTCSYYSGDLMQDTVSKKQHQHHAPISTKTTCWNERSATFLHPFCSSDSLISNSPSHMLCVLVFTEVGRWARPHFALEWSRGCVGTSCHVPRMCTRRPNIWQAVNTFIKKDVYSFSMMPTQRHRYRKLARLWPPNFWARSGHFLPNDALASDMWHADWSARRHRRSLSPCPRLKVNN